MEAVREKWTDERLDDLSGKVDDLGRRMDFRFDGMERRFEGIDLRFEGIDRRIDRLTWMMTTTMVTGFLTLAGLIVSQG